MKPQAEDLPDSVLMMWRREAVELVGGSAKQSELVVQLVAVIDQLRRERAASAQIGRSRGGLWAPPACSACGRLMIVDTDGETLRCLRCEDW